MRAHSVRAWTVLVGSTALFAALMVGSLAGSAQALGLNDLFGTSTTTSTTAVPVVDYIVDTVNGVAALPVGSTASSTTTSTSTTSTTTRPGSDPTSSTAPPATTPDQQTSVGDPGSDAAPVVQLSAGHENPREVAGDQGGGPAGPPAAAAVGLDRAEAVAAAPAPAALTPGRAGTGTLARADAAAPAIAPPAILIPGGRSTLSILNRLDGLDLAPSVVARILAPFPVVGPATYSDDFGAPRSRPAPHVHEGTDIFAARGTPVIASADGVIDHMATGTAIGGTSLRVAMKDGTYFYYAHLDRFAPSLAEGDHVGRGDVVGFVGTTGDAEGSRPHLHYEIHPRGGSAIDPVPYLDQWLAAAASTAAAVEAAPHEAAAALSARPPTAIAARPVVANPASHQAAPAPRAVALGPTQPISASAAGPAGLLVILALSWMAWRRTTRDRRRRRRGGPTTPLRPAAVSRSRTPD